MIHRIISEKFYELEDGTDCVLTCRCGQRFFGYGPDVRAAALSARMAHEEHRRLYLEHASRPHNRWETAPAKPL